jgi:hypothetical protein
MSQQQPDPLAFDPPPSKDDQAGWAQAERKALQFPGLFLERAKDLNEHRRELKGLRAEHDRVSGFVVRTLITVADNCQATLAQCREDGDVAASALAGVRRSVLALLEELHVFPVDLLGHTYEDVLVDGQNVEDPFDVQASTQSGKTSEVKVTAVIRDLWVRRREGYVEVLRRGLVTC